MLRALRPDDEAEARAAHAELAADDFVFLLGWSPDVAWADYVARQEDHRQGRNVEPGMVPATFLVADVDGAMVGRVSVRHALNDHLLRWGGHIGYGVRPAWRGRGLATAMLRASLDVARDVGISRALVVCEDGNVASARTIERCGGVLEDVVSDEEHPPTRRYLVEVPPPA